MSLLQQRKKTYWSFGIYYAEEAEDPDLADRTISEIYRRLPQTR
jgi:hypothetical protein